MTDKTMREKIAETIRVNTMYKWGAPYATDGILALKVAGVPLSELIEKAESGKLVELAEDQDFPRSPHLKKLCEHMDNIDTELGKGESDKSSLLHKTMSHLAAILAEVRIREKAIKRAGFRRVKVGPPDDTRQEG